MENSKVDEFIDIEKKPVWIGKNEFPWIGKITHCEKVKGKYGMDVRIDIQNDNGETRTFDLWGGNLNFMVNCCGNRFSDWLGRMVHVDRKADLKRVISLVLN